MPHLWQRTSSARPRGPLQPHIFKTNCFRHAAIRGGPGMLYNFPCAGAVGFRKWGVLFECWTAYLTVQLANIHHTGLYPPEQTHWWNSESKTNSLFVCVVWNYMAFVNGKLSPATSSSAFLQRAAIDDGSSC